MNDTLFVNINGPSEIFVNEGTNFSALCEANVNASIMWFFNGLEIEVDVCYCSSLSQ